MLYQFVNKRAEILTIAICHHRPFRQIVNHVFALLNFVPSLIAEVESWRTSLKSLNLASKPASSRKCPARKLAKQFWQRFFLRKFAIFLNEDFFFFWKTLEFRGKFAIFWAKTCSFLESTCALCPCLNIHVFGLAGVCSLKIGSWSWPRIFFVPLALCPRIHLCLIALIFIKLI